ncbi:MAG: hypothetical protein ACRCWI_03745 [Brevinema sp.]
MQTKSDILSQFSKGMNMVLSTSANDIVTSRTVSVMVYNDSLYFASVKCDRSIKNKQIAQNHHIALCSNKIQMTGQAFIVGLASESQNQDIINLYKQIFLKHIKCLSKPMNVILSNSISHPIKIGKLLTVNYPLLRLISKPLSLRLT